MAFALLLLLPPIAALGRGKNTMEHVRVTTLDAILRTFARRVLADHQVDIADYGTARESRNIMPARLCKHFKLPIGSTYRQGSKVWKRTHYPVYWDLNPHMHPRKKRRVKKQPEDIAFLERMLRLEDPRK